jgi:hypothetical protein
MTDKPRRRGRPPLKWLDAAGLHALPVGTAVLVETGGRHANRLTGRIRSHSASATTIATPTGEVTLPGNAVKRARTVEAVYEPGDPVVRRGISADAWRGGVVRTEGTQVLVEQIGGAFAWFAEDDLEPPESRDEALPELPRGPVPARA